MSAVCSLLLQMLKEVVKDTLKQQRITEAHECFAACSQRLFDISKFYLKVRCLLCSWGALVRVVMFLSDISVQVAFVLLLYACCQAALKWTQKYWSKTAVHLIYLAFAFVYRKLLQPEALVFFLTDFLLSWSLSINW